ncbi:formate dehydrogenase subunit delta [Marinobacter sp.]|uniref:formate dehydrogenase subunit delta n=1 Tax=Marinobacter sp. TaxID=50741 RepID=UPI0034A4B816
MSDQQLQHLVRMINQISATNLHHGDEATAAEVVAGHMRKFWARSMKQMIVEYADTDGTELLPVSRQAVERLKK